VLGDEEKRRVYDKYGDLGLQMMGTMMSPLFDPKIESMLCTLLLSMALLLILIIIFFVFLTVRIDSQVVWSWAVVWIPAWIINIIVFFSILQYIMAYKGKDKQDQYFDKEDETSDQEAKRLKQHNRQVRIAAKSLLLFNFGLALLFQIFIVIRLDNRVAWTACQVFIPYFVYEGVQFFVNTIKALVGCLALKSVSERKQIPIFLFSQYWFSALRFVFFLLIALRIDQIIGCSWGIVFIPLYLAGLKWALELVYRYRIYAKMTQPEMAHQGKMTVLAGAVAYAVVCFLFYTLVGLIARRLDGLSYVSMANAFVPLFLVFVSLYNFWFVYCTYIYFYK
jgi:hypothetical protein